MRLNCASLFVTLKPFLTCLYEMKGAKMEGWLHIRKNHGKLLDVGGVVGGSNGLATYKKRFVRRFAVKKRWPQLCVEQTIEDVLLCRYCLLYLL